MRQSKGLDTLLNKARERMNLSCYTPWERDFLSTLLEQYDRTGTLSEKQTAKLKEIVLARYVLGEPPHIDANGRVTGAPFPWERIKQRAQ